MIGLAFARVVGILSRVPWPVWLALAVLLTGLFWGNHRYSQGVTDERAVWEARIAAGKARGDAATVTAAGTRATDTIANTKAEEARNAAIANATPGQAPDDANRRLACQRLRTRPDFDPVATGCGR